MFKFRGNNNGQIFNIKKLFYRGRTIKGKNDREYYNNIFILKQPYEHQNLFWMHNSIQNSLIFLTTLKMCIIKNSEYDFK